MITESPEKSPKSRPRPPAEQRKRPELPKEAQEVSKEFAQFLNKRLERTSVSDVSKHVKGMVDKIQRTELISPEQVDDLSAHVQDFYSGFQKRLETHPLYKSKKSDFRILRMLSIFLKIFKNTEFSSFSDFCDF